jgi:hypothetical protein
MTSGHQSNNSVRLSVDLMQDPAHIQRVREPDLSGLWPSISRTQLGSAALTQEQPQQIQNY